MCLGDVTEQVHKYRERFPEHPVSRAYAIRFLSALTILSPRYGYSWVWAGAIVDVQIRSLAHIIDSWSKAQYEFGCLGVVQ